MLTQRPGATNLRWLRSGAVDVALIPLPPHGFLFRLCGEQGQVWDASFASATRRSDARVPPQRGGDGGVSMHIKFEDRSGDCLGRWITTLPSDFAAVLDDAYREGLARASRYTSAAWQARLDRFWTAERLFGDPMEAAAAIHRIARSHDD